MSTVRYRRAWCTLSARWSRGTTSTTRRRASSRRRAPSARTCCRCGGTSSWRSSTRDSAGTCPDSSDSSPCYRFTGWPLSTLSTQLRTTLNCSYFATYFYAPMSIVVVWSGRCTGWRRINRTFQSFKGVYENLHKITPLKLLAHRQMRKQKKRNVHTNILR